MNNADKLKIKALQHEIHTLGELRKEIDKKCFKILCQIDKIRVKNGERQTIFFSNETGK